jgi:hypothetical protein
VSHLTLDQHNQAIAIQRRMETPIAQIFARVLSQETPLTEVPGYIEILHALATCEAPDDTCAEAILFLAEAVYPIATNTVQ